MIIRAKTFKSWMKANLSDYMEDISRYGCEGGFPGLTYYTDTCKLFDRFQDEIIEALATDAEEFGCKGIADYLCNYANYDKVVTDNTTHKNFLVWWYAEKIANELTNN